MKHVELRVRHIMARQAFKAGWFEGRLDEVGSNGIPTGVVAFTTRNHETWASAAMAALKKADRMAWDVVHHGMILRRIEAEAAENQRIEEAEAAKSVRARERAKEIEAARPPPQPFDEARAASAWKSIMTKKIP